MFGQRLRLARKKAGLSMQGLADMVTPSVTAQAISKYEADKMMPSSSVLVGLGRALGVSLDFLLSSNVSALESVEWRKNSKASAQDIAAAQSIVIEKLDDYFSIESVLELQDDIDPFERLRVLSVQDDEDIERKAIELRNEWLLGNDPIPSMTSLLEEKGIKVVEADLPEKINGLACHVQHGASSSVDVVVVSKNTNVERKRFNLAHELAHRVIIETGNPNIKKETAMNRFAGAFLIPRDHLIEEAGSERQGMVWIEIMRLKKTYGVSAAAMLLRLGQVGILNQNSVEYAFRTYAKSWRTSEPKPIGKDEGFSSFEKPQRFENLVWRALGEQLISPIRAAKMLGISLSEVERNIRGPIEA